MRALPNSSKTFGSVSGWLRAGLDLIQPSSAEQTVARTDPELESEPLCGRTVTSYNGLWFVLIGGAAALALFPGRVQPAAAEPWSTPTTIEMRYTLNIFSLPFGEIDYSAQFRPRAYAAKMRLRTSGLAAALWKSEIDTSADGRITPEGMRPISYSSLSQSRSGKQQRVRVNYGGPAGPVMEADPPYDLSQSPVTEAQKKDAADPLTAITSVIAGLSGTDRTPCGRPLAIFDGRRRYDVRFAYVRSAPAPLGSAGRVCRAEYYPVAGIKQEVVDVSAVPALQVELVDVTENNVRYAIAERVSSSFLFGAVSANLTELKINGRPVLPGASGLSPSKS